MAGYVDGFVLPVPTEQLDAYREMASSAGATYLEHGALSYFEGVGDDLDPDTGDMPIRHFQELAGIDGDESVVFAFIGYESREHRDEVNATVMDEWEANPDDDVEMPFDPARMAYGGFSSLVSLDTD